MNNVLIVDDHAIVRDGIKRIITDLKNFDKIEDAGSGHEAIQKILKKNYNLVVLDISLPGRDGIEILKEIKTIRPKTSVLILSMYSEEMYGVRALRAGADGYVCKESASKDLIDAIQIIQSGKKYISPTLAGKIALNISKNITESLHERLSDREYQIVCKIARGKTISEIAEDLALSKQSISTYRARALEKMSMKNNGELMSYAIKNGLVD